MAMKYKEMKDREVSYYAYVPSLKLKTNIVKVVAIDFFNQMIWVRVGRKEQRVSAAHATLLQVLGQKKTYGSDIYEGCIVKITKSNGEVFYEAIKWDKRGSYNGYDTIGFQDIAKTYLNYDEKAKFKAVGNIFENSDLLEAKK